MLCQCCNIIGITDVDVNRWRRVQDEKGSIWQKNAHLLNPHKLDIQAFMGLKVAVTSWKPDAIMCHLMNLMITILK